MSEHIRAAAIIKDGKIWSMPKPNRHHNIIHMMHDAGLKQIDAVQGFITNTDRFVTRKEGRAIAIAAGQCEEDDMHTMHSLFTEDLW